MKEVTQLNYESKTYVILPERNEKRDPIFDIVESLLAISKILVSAYLKYLKNKEK